jgi:hypothetical protein
MTIQFSAKLTIFIVKRKLLTPIFDYPSNFCTVFWRFPVGKAPTAYFVSSCLGAGSFLASITTWYTKSVTHF